MNFTIFNYGCASNLADSNFIRQVLLDKGFTETNIDFADFVIVNTCAVKGPTESKIRYFIKNIKKDHKKIIIAGCLTGDNKFKEEFKDYSMINPYNIHLIGELIEEITKQNKPIQFLDYKTYNKTNLYYNTKAIAIVQPLIGCLGNCTYCKTKQAKPIFMSFPLESIINRIKYYKNIGAKEIWLSSEDNAAYGFDKNTNIIELLNKTDKIGIPIRLGMANPWLLFKYKKELTDFFKKTNNYFKFLHIPIQSASNKVLKDMNRPYTKKQLDDFFSYIRKHFNHKELTLATDIIVGFPGETQEEFKETLDFIKKYDFLVCNISQFWPRPDTIAAKMKQLDTKIKKERSIEITKICKQINKKLLEQYIGDTLRVFGEKEYKNAIFARTENYVSVKVKNGKLFEWQKVKIIAVENHHLIGELI